MRVKEWYVLSKKKIVFIQSLIEQYGNGNVGVMIKRPGEPFQELDEESGKRELTEAMVRKALMITDYDKAPLVATTNYRYYNPPKKIFITEIYRYFVALTDEDIDDIDTWPTFLTIIELLSADFNLPLSEICYRFKREMKWINGPSYEVFRSYIDNAHRFLRFPMEYTVKHSDITRR